jgi:ubiquinone/menaquinone biosynthesis C-methylase UbiE
MTIGQPPGQPPICNYEGSNYQSTFWEHGGRAYEDQVEAIALQRLLPPSGQLLLEIGAGAGRNTPRYNQFNRIVLLDYSLSQLQQAQIRLGVDQRYIFVAADAYRLPFIPGLFDAATMIRTLHHIVDVPKVFNQIRRVLQPEAIFILEYANKQNLKAIFRYALHRQDWSPFTPEPIEFALLNFDFNPSAIRSWLTESGFFIERQLTVSHFRVGFIKRFMPLKLLVKLDSFAQLTGKWWQLTPSVFVRARANLSVSIKNTAGAEPQPTIPSALGGYFKCLECGHSPLTETPSNLICSACGRQWPIRAGIYDFRDQ